MGASGWCAGSVAYERDGELVGEHHLHGESAVYGRESLVGEWSDKSLSCIWACEQVGVWCRRPSKFWCMGASGWCAGRVAYEWDGELVGEHHLQGESAVYGRESLVGERSDKLLPCI